MIHSYLIWIISLLTIIGLILRPFRLPEVVWALGGAIVLLICGLITLKAAGAGIAKGTDVYLFLAGMMLLSETARDEKLFDWLAAHAIKAAKGSPKRLFLLVYLTGIVVTALLSNDATAVVLTPAVIAAVRTAKIKNPLPYVLICAFIANAASFLLPIANPANLVIYNAHLPSLPVWIESFLLPAIISIILTYFVLKQTQLKKLAEPFEDRVVLQPLSKTGKLALYGILITVLVLLTCSAMDIALGWPTFITGLICTLIISLRAHKPVYIVFAKVSWSVLALVAGLFIIVEALSNTGLTTALATHLSKAAGHQGDFTALFTGIGLALSCNLVNNLPAGLIAGQAMHAAVIPEIVRRAVLIAVDLGPNLSVTGSLATILWLIALRREGISISGWQFFRVGIPVMLIPLLVSLLSLFLGS